MAQQDVLKQLEERARAEAAALDLSEMLYSIDDAAKILQMSRAKLYRYVSEHGITTLIYENNRKQFLLADDIRGIYVSLHMPHARRTKRPPVQPALVPAGAVPRIEAIA